MFKRSIPYGASLCLLRCAPQPVEDFDRSMPGPKTGFASIVAQSVADPGTYVGARIEIYGLVIQSDLTARELLLEDVSQRPLRVDTHNLSPIGTGDQVEIQGVVQQDADGLVLIGESFKRVQVVAGGGCC